MTPLCSSDSSNFQERPCGNEPSTRTMNLTCEHVPPRVTPKIFKQRMMRRMVHPYIKSEKKTNQQTHTLLNIGDARRLDMHVCLSTCTNCFMSMCLTQIHAHHLDTCVYTYMYMYICICIYIYMHMTTKAYICCFHTQYTGTLGAPSFGKLPEHFKKGVVLLLVALFSSGLSQNGSSSCFSWLLRVLLKSPKRA